MNRSCPQIDSAHGVYKFRLANFLCAMNLMCLVIRWALSRFDYGFKLIILRRWVPLYGNKSGFFVYVSRQEF